MKLRYIVLSIILVLPNQSSAILGIGDVVFDPSVYQQTVMTAIESVNQTIKQVQQYETQLQQYMTQIQQYENMVTNTVAPAAYVWDQANATIGKVMGYVNTISQYQNTAGNLDSYLAKFQNTGYYRSSPCYSASGCSPTDKQTISDNQATSSAAQKTANDAVLRMVDQQQNQLTADAAQLSSLQSSAQGATGQMQALGYANQLASSEVNQLMQIRGILIAQQAAAATRAEAVNDRESQEQAGSDLFRSGSYTKSSGQGWGF